MKLWTIQTIDFLEKLNQDNFITASKDCIDPVFHNAYHWMIKQMNKRNIINTKPNSSPIWAWYQCYSFNKKRPDLRYSGHLKKGKKGVLIEIEINKEDVLLSDFNLWHFVLNNWHISDNDIEENQNINNQNKIEESWEKIFNLNYFSENHPIPINNKQIQATFWSLNKKQITNLTFFTAK